MDSDTLRERTGSENQIPPKLIDSEKGLSAKLVDSGDAYASDPGIPVKTVALVEEGHVDPCYQAKAQLLNDAIQEIGMGRYQWHLFIVAGFGWFSDNVHSLSLFAPCSVLVLCFHEPLSSIDAD
jgi:hypothetical protein